MHPERCRMMKSWGGILLTKFKKADYIIIVFLLLLIAGIAGFTIASCLQSNSRQQAASASRQLQLADLDGKPIAVKVGTNFDGMVSEKLPKSKMSYYDTQSDLVEALKTGKVDGFTVDEPVIKYMMTENSDLDYVREYMDSYEYAFAFPKTDEGKALCDEMSEFLHKIKGDGTLKEIDEVWFSADKSRQVIPPLSELSGEKGTLNFAVEAAYAPFIYMQDQKIVGYEIDIAYRFCKEYGYGLKIQDMNFGAIIPSLASGKCDLGAAGMTVTAERAESIYFSESDYEGGAVIAVRAEDMHGTGQPAASFFNGKRIGILTGSNYEGITFEHFPDSEYFYFDNISDLTTALLSNKIDGFLTDEPGAMIECAEIPDIDYLKKKIVDDDYSFGFQKDSPRGEKLMGEFNALIAELKASGELDALKQKWMGSDESVKVVDKTKLTGENGEISIVYLSGLIPFSYTSGQERVGYCVELVQRFAEKYGYSLREEETTISSCLSGIVTGKYDILACGLSYTEERAQSVNYSDVFYNGGVVLVGRSSDISGNPQNNAGMAFFASIAKSFEKNFIREDRYKLILEGISVTCAITALSVVFGSVLAFLICLLRRVDSVLAGKICNLYVKLLQGTPVVVLLMILYYVVFGQSDLSSIWVGVIGFSLNFAAYVSEILRTGIESIESGQREAALALGYTENQAFFRFIFPQAAVRQMSVYRGEIISLLKNTSIVGYIAIQDLTKMSDIIRSRTYEAFFPLIATAVIYFILAWIISIILNLILKKMDPLQRKRTVKGVKTT